MDKITPKSIAEGIHSCIANAERYLSSARTLRPADRQSSYLLYLYALEEMGKVILIFNSVFYITSKTEWQKWQKKFKDHGEKMWYSKDLDDIAEGRRASKLNSSDVKRAVRKLEVAYVDFRNGTFLAPEEVRVQDLDEIEAVASIRMEYLHLNHPSVRFDENRMKKAIEQLSGKTMNEIDALVAKKLGN